MARRPRSSKLENRTARLQLSVRKKPHHFTTIAPGIALGYRRCKGAGRWIVRCADGHGGNWTKAFAVADDHEDSDGEHVLTFWEAQDRARALARGKDVAGARPGTVGDALDAYAADLKARGGLPNNVSRVRHHLSPALLTKPVALLAAKELRRWRDDLIADGMKAATVNRTVRGLKAALNLAAAHDPQRITNQSAWAIGLAGLPDAHRARNVILTDEQVHALIAAAYAEDEALGVLVETAAGTGARPSQLARLEVSDLQADRPDPRLMMPSSRKGRGRKRITRRAVPITPSLAARLRQAAQGRAPDERLLLKSDATPWRSETSDHKRPFASAAARAGLPNVTIYALRHSSIVRQLIARVPIRLVAVTHDTSVTMIERSYSKHIDEQGDALVRPALLDTAPPAAGNVATLSGRRS